ncbi:MAG: DUF2250 domain-containing protein [candidate division Zixibacteria bacterium]|nr:DUF2250 domain-containing protein [candidate division Zixibacteria bacterium]
MKEQYVLARCCSPSSPDRLIGYYSRENVLKVHRAGCSALANADQARLVSLSWTDILAPEPFRPGDDYPGLDDVDFRILAHHDRYGIDYSLAVARHLSVDRDTAFARHRSLRDRGLLERVEPTMVQYKKGFVNNKWIKHRNHTYYAITDRGRAYLSFYREHSEQ